MIKKLVKYQRKFVFSNTLVMNNKKLRKRDDFDYQGIGENRFIIYTSFE